MKKLIGYTRICGERYSIILLDGKIIVEPVELKQEEFVFR